MGQKQVTATRHSCLERALKTNDRLNFTYPKTTLSTVSSDLTPSSPVTFRTID